MPLNKLKTLNSKPIYRNPYWVYCLDEYTLPEGAVGEYNYIHTRGSSMIVPITPEGKLILVRQFRYLWKKESLEFPSGGMKKSNPLTTAKNELAEEAHLSASHWELVGEYNPFNGVTDEVARVYVAWGLRASYKKRDLSEQFEIEELSVPEFESVIVLGKIWDGMTLAAWMLARPAVLRRLNEQRSRKVSRGPKG